jgi:hypothetical protein
MLANAEVVAPNAIRLDTKNVVAVTLSPASPLIDPAKPLRISWNGAAAQTVSLTQGRVRLNAPEYVPSPKEKNAAVAGPMGRALSTPFAVIVGTVAPDNMTRELCRRKADEIAGFWNTWQHQPVRMFKDTEFPESEWAKYSLVLIGGAEANAVTRKLVGLLPLKIAGDEITVDGHSFKAPDAVLTMVYPHPLNPERYVLLAASTSPEGMYFLDTASEELSSYDFAIVDGAFANPRKGRPVDKVRIAAGHFDNGWRYDQKLVQVASRSRLYSSSRRCST